MEPFRKIYLLMMIVVISAFDGPWKLLCVCVCVCVYVFMYIRIYTISYTLMVLFHRLMSFKVRACVNLNGTYRKEDRTQQEKKVLLTEKGLKLLLVSR